MRLTASATRGKALALDLYIFGPSTAAVPGMALKRSSLTYGSRGPDRPDSKSGRTLAGAPPEIRRWFGDAKAGTWLRGSMPAEQLSRDVMPVWTETILHDPRAATVTGAINAALNRAVLVGIVFGGLPWLEEAWRNRKNDRICRGPRRRHVISPLLLSLAVTGVVWSLAYGAFLNTVSVRRGDRHPGETLYDRSLLKRAWFAGARFSHDLQERGRNPAREPVDIAGRIRAGWSDEMIINAEGPPDEPSLLCVEDEKGTTVWFQSRKGDRVHLVTWRADGRLDLRPGRIPVWELPPGTAGNFNWR